MIHLKLKISLIIENTINFICRLFALHCFLKNNSIIIRTNNPNIRIIKFSYPNFVNPFNDPRVKQINLNTN